MKILGIIFILIAIFGGGIIADKLEKAGMTSGERKHLYIGWLMAFIASIFIALGFLFINY